MKRGILIVLILSLFAAVTFAADSSITLQPGDVLTIDCTGDSLTIIPDSNTRLRVDCVGVTPTETPPTATVPPVATDPYPGAPECPDHDDRAFHLLWNEKEGCHYDHEHGAEYPQWARDLWGDYTEFTGYEIGYAWETPGENANKHPGYNFGGQQFDTCRIDFADGGISAAWVQAHGMANHMGQQARIHSFWAQYELCNEDGSAGLIYSGGHADFGQLHTPGYKEGVASPDVYPKAPPPYNLHQPPYVGLAETIRHFETWNSLTTRQSRPFVNEHELIGFAFRIFDPVHGMLPDGEILDFGGNSSSRQFYEFSARVPASLAGPNGLVNFNGFTDVHGNIAPSCTAVSADCVPLVIVNALPGTYHTNGTAMIGIRNGYEGDIYFGSQPSGWIGPMN